MTQPEHAPAAGLVAWYLAMGVDEAVGDEPADWFARAAPEGKPRNRAGQRPDEPGEAAPARVAPKPAPSRPPAPTPMAARDAGAKAGEAASLEELEAMVGAFDGCPLKATAKNLCFARGSAHARAMLIGEAPGRDEDLQGRPFVGRAGKLLDKMLAAIGLGEDDVYITNVVYWRPPGNRTPTPQEVQACRPFLERQIELVDPDILVFLGGAAAKQMFDTSEGIMRLRGKWRTGFFGGKERRAIATLHPAYLLRNPSAKRLAWHDLQQIKAALTG